MEILQKDDTKKGMFYIVKENEIRAQMTYVWAGEDRIIIDHTEVDDKLRGKNAGKQLVAKAVDFAREKILKSFHFVLLQKLYLIKLKYIVMYSKKTSYG